MTIDSVPPLQLVLVQLGPRPSFVLEKNLERIRSEFPELQVTLIHDKSSWRWIKDIDAIFFQYEPHLDQMNLSWCKNRNPRFRQGFWKFSLERLLAILTFHQQTPDIRVLHIENDVLLLPHFPFGSLSDYTNPTWCRFNESKDVASVMYLPDCKSSVWLKDELIALLERGQALSDMEALSYLSHKYPSKISLFPSYTEALAPQLLNFNNPHVLSSGSNSLQEIVGEEGIFDPAAIGMWLCGLDPENHHGRLIIHDRGIIDSGDSFIDPSRSTYQVDAAGNLSITVGTRKVPVFNLHIHSKDSGLFSLNWVQVLRSKVELASNPKVLRKLIFRSLMKILWMQRRDRTLFRYILSEPRVYAIIMRLRKLLTSAITTKKD